MTMTLEQQGIEILERARQLIKNETGWTQGCFARNRFGKPCPVAHGVQFDAPGARMRAAMDLNLRNTQADGWTARLLDEASDRVVSESGKLITRVPQSVNDKLGHAAALRMFELAIEAAHNRERRNEQKGRERSKPRAQHPSAPGRGDEAGGLPAEGKEGRT